MLDSKVMDEHLGIDRSVISSRYKRLAEQELPDAEAEGQQPAPQMEMAFTPPTRRAPQQAPAQAPQEERPPSLARPGKAFAEDGPAWIDGPLESEILAWKKQFGRVYRIAIEGDAYIFRALSRFEYKQVMSAPNTNELVREEMISEICVLFPYDYSYEEMVNEPGGVPSLIAENIMKKSGFTRNVEVVPL